MSSFFESGPLPDWKELRTWLGKDLPWELAEKWDGRGDANWLNDYVKQILSNEKTASRPQTQNLLQFETKQTKKSVSISVKFVSDVDIRKLQLFATSDRLKIEGLPGDKKRAIPLPCLVYPRSGIAAMKKDRLVVRFKRKPLEKTEYELFIQP
ncbi:hypothetical protein ACF3MZ_06150 [Paenibacillaceae bacterium WGS1546]|uniref:hypothetical protein n=1 Tax=Cohnella sp. WGS1546 TaxID=3366810 RepID=UPI00372D4F71